MSLTVSAIVSEYGAYYKNNGQNADRLRQRFFVQSDTEKLFRMIPTVQTQEDFGVADITRVLQPFQKAFTDLGDVTFTPETIKLYNMKVDVSIYPDDIKNSWLQFLAGLEPAERANWPLVRYLMEEHILGQRDEDYELNEIYKGVYAAPTPGTAGAASTAMNGIKKKIVDGIAASKVQVVTLGSVPSAPEDYVDYVEAFVAGIPHVVRKKLDVIPLSEDNHLKYRKGKRIKYNDNYAQESSLDTIADYPNIKVMGLASMGNSEKLWTTPAMNRIGFYKTASGDVMKVQEDKREVAIMGDNWKGIGFPYLKYVFTNDQDNSF